MTIVSAIGYAFYEVIKICLNILKPIIIGVVLFVSIRMIYRHKKYGYDYFDVFKKREKIDTKRLTIIEMLKEIDNNTLIYEETNYNSSIIAITKYGLFIIALFPYQSVYIEGNTNDKEITYWYEKQYPKKTINPFYQISLDKELLKTKLNINIREYAIFDTLSHISIKGDTSNLLRTNEFYYKLQSLWHEKSIYTKEEMDNFYKKV